MEQWRAIAILLLMSCPLARGGESLVSSTQPARYEQFIIIPLRVHILRSADVSEIDCKLTDADIQRILTKVNGIWRQAGIHFGLDTIIREPAAMQEEFKTARAHDTSALPPYRLLRPEASRTFDGLHVYFVHQLPVNGVYMGQGFAFVKETASLRPVEGGIDKPIPRVTAHELGHALGLPHRQDSTNLLASGTTGTTLNDAEIVKSRQIGAKIKGAASMSEWQREATNAQAKSDTVTALRVWTWLADIPGDGAQAAAQQRDRLKLQILDHAP